MAQNLDAVCREVGNWITVTRFANAHIFGSLIHKGGAQFDPQLSDVDLICCFAAGDSYLSRWTSIAAAAPSIGDLNLRLLKLFGRTDASKPIVSVVPVSSFELEAGLHKDKSTQFFSHNEFLCVSTKQIGPLGKEHQTVAAPLEGALDAVREAQRVRNKILAIAPTGTCSFEDYRGQDVLPKTLARAAAQVRWAREKNRKTEQRFDVNEGLVYTLQLLAARRNEAEPVDQLLQRIVVRMGGRGQRAPISITDQLLLWEILADDAAALLPLKATKTPGAPAARQRLSITRNVREQAFIRAGYRCTFPGCAVPLGEDGIGEIALIRSLTPGGPRYDSSQTDAERLSVDNLIVLCPTHHQVVDMSPAKYTADIVKSWNDESTNKKSPNDAFSSENLFTMVKLIVELIVKA